MKIHAALVSVLLTLTLGACDEPSPDDRGGMPGLADEEIRTPLGKADVIEGRCAAVDADGPACGGPAPVGNCWCDEACLDFGDCCHDAFDVCEVGEPSPAPTCDDGSPLHPLCDIKPACDDGQVAAIQNGCFACVDADTCEPPQEVPSCADGTSLSPFCDVPPLCPAGTETFIVGSCFSCLDPATCEPAA